MLEMELLQDLRTQVEAVAPGDTDALHAVRTRAQMLIRRIFGAASEYHSSLDAIRFTSITSSRADVYAAWNRGHAQMINLVETMQEERRVFDANPTPTLTIQDDELRDRTVDLLSAPGNFDRILREATTVLENRIRHKVPFDDLAKLIPKSADQTGDKLINKLMAPESPVVVYGDKQRQTRVFRILGGVVAYLRNPSHHTIDDSVKWSWAWSVVGLVDQLLDDLEAAIYQRPSTL